MKRLLVSVHLLLLSVMGFSQMPFKEFVESIDWTMTEDAFVQSHRDLMHSIEYQENEYGNWFANYEVSGIMLGENDLRFLVCISNSSKQLKHLIGSIVSADETLERMNQVENLIKDNLGDPYTVKDNTVSDPDYWKLKEMCWFYENYAITLSFLHISSFSIRLNIEPYDNSQSDVMGLNWGDSRETVERTIGEPNKSPFNDDYQHSGYFCAISSWITYHFKDDMLNKVTFFLFPEKDNDYNYYDKLRRIYSFLYTRYGKPYLDIAVWDNDIYRYNEDLYDYALKRGYVSFRIGCDLEKTEIQVDLFKGDDGIVFMVEYKSKYYKLQ